jgi:hypothetical protein
MNIRFSEGTDNFITFTPYHNKRGEYRVHIRFIPQYNKNSAVVDAERFAHFLEDQVIPVLLRRV